MIFESEKEKGTRTEEEGKPSKDRISWHRYYPT